MLTTIPWEPRWTCAEVETASPAATGIAALAATQVLDSLSGNQFGLAPVTLRPCRRACAGDVLAAGLFSWAGYPWPTWYGGSAWVNLGCGGCGDDCSCTTLAEAELPGQVYDITQVKLDGVVVTGTAYRLDRSPQAAGTLLVRLDGGTWPLCQDLSKADGAG